MTPTLQAHRTQRPYACGIAAVAVAWLLGLCVSWGLHEGGLTEIDPSLLLAVGIGSGLIAIAGGLPGLATELLPATENTLGRITIGFSSALVIRLLGTVALLGLCSYHMPAAKKEIAGTILAWYLYLTAVDVTVLASLLPRHDRPSESEISGPRR